MRRVKGSSSEKSYQENKELRPCNADRQRVSIMGFASSPPAPQHETAGKQGYYEKDGSGGLGCRR